VTRSMCPDCRGFFQKMAQHTGQPQVVRDAEMTRIFNPDGRVIVRFR